MVIMMICPISPPCCPHNFFHMLLFTGQSHVTCKEYILQICPAGSLSDSSEMKPDVVQDILLPEAKNKRTSTISELLNYYYQLLKQAGLVVEIFFTLVITLCLPSCLRQQYMFEGVQNILSFSRGEQPTFHYFLIFAEVLIFLVKQTNPAWNL